MAKINKEILEESLKYKFSFDRYRKLINIKTPKSKVLFVVTCFEEESGEIFPIPYEAYDTFQTLLGQTPIQAEKGVCFLPVFPFLGLPEDDIGGDEIREYRDFLYENIKKIDPNLIIPLGNTATHAILKISGIANKRGREFYLDIDGKRYSIMPTLHPVVAYLEPSTHKLFVQDLTNAYNKVILNLNKFKDKGYTLCMTMNMVREEFRKAYESKEVAVDLETTGLDFLQDKVTVFGASYSDKQAFVVPMYHAESPFTPGEIDEIKVYISALMSSKTKKLLANAKFDLKFMRNMGMTRFENIEDIQLIHSLTNENARHSLSDMIKELFPLDIEDY